LEAGELQQVYEQLTQREARLRDAQAAAAADADAARAELATREAAAAAKLRAAEETEARLQAQRDQAEQARQALPVVYAMTQALDCPGSELRCAPPIMHTWQMCCAWYQTCCQTLHADRNFSHTLPGSLPSSLLHRALVRCDCGRTEAEAKLSELARQEESAITAQLKRRNDLDAASAQVQAPASIETLTQHRQHAQLMSDRIGKHQFRACCC